MKRKTNKTFLIVTIVIGIVLGILEEFVYNDELINFGSKIPCITVYMALFALVMGLILLFVGLSNGTFVNFGKVMLFTILAFVTFVGSSALFEFLYELGGNDTGHQASRLQYVFLIDDSGSMAGNDPAGQRYDAVESIVNNLTPTNDFAVYAFGSNTQRLTPMGSTNSSYYQFNRNYTPDDGGTYMINAIEDIIKDVCGDDDVHTKIIMLTDGDPSDNGFGKYKKLARKCIKEGASVSSVGFGAPNESFLQDLADDTGGVYVFSDNLSSLTQDLEKIVNTKSVNVGVNRDLLGDRLDATYDSFWYGFLRVFFLIILGALWSVIKLLLVGEKKFTQLSAVLSIVLCTLAALILEIALYLGADGGLMRVIFCAMWACTLIPDIIYEKVDLGRALNSGQSGAMGSGVAQDFSTRSREGGGPKAFL